MMPQTILQWYKTISSSELRIKPNLMSGQIIITFEIGKICP